MTDSEEKILKFPMQNFRTNNMCLRLMEYVEKKDPIIKLGIPSKIKIYHNLIWKEITLSTFLEPLIHLWNCSS